MGIHPTVVQFKHYVCRPVALESPLDNNRLTVVILLVTLFTWSVKVRFSSSLMPRNLAVETLIRIVPRILMSNASFWLEIIICEVLLTFRGMGYKKR